MSCYQREPPDEIITVSEFGLTGQKIFDDVTAAVEKLREIECETRVGLYRGMGQSVVRTKTGESLWIDPNTWIIKGWKK